MCEIVASFLCVLQWSTMKYHHVNNRKYTYDISHANLQFSLMAMNRHYWSIPLRLYPSVHSLSLALWYLNHDLILPPCRPLLLPAPRGFVSAYIDRERHGPKNTRCIEAGQDICVVCALHRNNFLPVSFWLDNRSATVLYILATSLTNEDLRDT